jgi:hypothetical protein
MYRIAGGRTKTEIISTTPSFRRLKGLSILMVQILRILNPARSESGNRDDQLTRALCTICTVATYMNGSPICVVFIATTRQPL